MSVIAIAIGITTMVATLSIATPAQAAPPPAPACVANEPGHGMPIRIPFGPADFGAQPEACARTTASLEGRGALTIATEQFYGSLLGGASLRATLALPNHAWLSLWIPGFEYRFVANATVEAEQASLGAGALGYHVPLTLSEHVMIAPFVRVLLPSETVFVRARRYGVEHGATMLVALSRRVELIGGLSFDDLVTLNGSRALFVWTPAIGADLVYRPWRALGIAGGLGVRPLDAIDPRISVRLYPFRGVFTNVSATRPLVGRDRTDVALGLSLGWEMPTR